MKRSELKRTTPLKRKRGLKPKSSKTRKTERQSNPIRAAYVETAAGKCERCKQIRRLSCHEIGAGSSRQRSIRRGPLCWLAVCSECHDYLQGASHAENVAVKCRAVVGAFNEVLGRIELGIKSLEIVSARECDCDFCPQCRRATFPFDFVGEVCCDCNAKGGEAC